MVDWYFLPDFEFGSTRKFLLLACYRYVEHSLENIFPNKHLEHHGLNDTEQIKSMFISYIR